jgi:hypothetical protein
MRRRYEERMQLLRQSAETHEQAALEAAFVELINAGPLG